ncbi:MAG: ATP-binding cassette domain-containing protein [Caldilineaceae bacterium]
MKATSLSTSVSTLSTSSRWLVPQARCDTVDQSATAVIEALCQGLHRPVAATEIAQALQTAAIETAARESAADGLSLALLQHVVTDLGFTATVEWLPADHILLPVNGALPAVVLLKDAGQPHHYGLLWRRQGPFVQLLDPLVGRRWLTEQQLAAELCVQQATVSATAWQQWATSAAFQQSLRHRLQRLELNRRALTQHLTTAQMAADWRTLARLDAATRFVAACRRARAVASGAPAQKLLTYLLTHSDIEVQGQSAAADEIGGIPAPYWSGLPRASEDPASGANTDQTVLRQSVALLVLRSASQTAAPTVTDTAVEPTSAGETTVAAPATDDPTAPLTEAPAKPSVQSRLLHALSADGRFVPSAIAFATITAALSVTFEALLLKGILHLGAMLNLYQQRVTAVIMVLAFFGLLLTLSVLIFGVSLHLGRRIETRLRIDFLRKIPKLHSHYFTSRPIADLVQRAFSLAEIRDLPDRVGEILEQLALLLFTAIGIIWLDPGSALTVIVAIIGYFGLLRFFFPLIMASSYQVRVEDNYVERYPLDALRGLIPIRTHGAERALRRVFDEKLVDWSNAQQGMFQVLAIVQSLVAFLYAGVVAWLLYRYVNRGGALEGILLLAYWALNLPKILNDLTQAISGYASVQGLGKMLYEPLDAPEEFAEASGAEAIGAESDVTAPELSAAVAISFQNVTLELLGKTVLRNVSFAIQPGEQVGIVGSSGAGKSTLLGLLLGWYQPTSGQVLVNGQPLDGALIRALRQRIAWVDPSIQLQNRTLLENLIYGATPSEAPPVARLIEQADLAGVLERLPAGLRTQVGEEGGMLSGGEGQRVRLGRAMLRGDAPLTLLDEPFRGLDREKRRELLRRARTYWANATLLCVTHDVGETQSFGRVLVVEEGRIVEDAAPATLLAQADSRYSTLLRAEAAVRAGLWEAADWRRLWLAEGRLREIGKSGDR